MTAPTLSLDFRSRLKLAATLHARAMLMVSVGPAFVWGARFCAAKASQLALEGGISFAVPDAGLAIRRFLATDAHCRVPLPLARFGLRWSSITAAACCRRPSKRAATSSPSPSLDAASGVQAPS